MDDLLGRGKNHVSKHLAPSAPMRLVAESAAGKRTTFLSGMNIRRPQLLFPDKIDNSNSPFVQKIKVKTNAKRPLDYGDPDGISVLFAAHVKSLGISSLDNHPYEFEINTIEYPAHILSQREEIMYKSDEDTPFTFVETEEQVRALVELLNQAQEIAVDLEV
jgi:exosome complex exonuclease RRP6